MEQTGEVLGKAKKGLCETRGRASDGAGRLAAGKKRDGCVAEQQRLNAKGFIMYFRDPKGSLGGTELFGSQSVQVSLQHQRKAFKE